jgi:hypothetical protein
VDVVARHTADGRDCVMDRFSATPVEQTHTCRTVALRAYRNALVDELDADAMIRWIDVHPDHTTRAELAEIPAAVDSLS